MPAVNIILSIDKYAAIIKSHEKVIVPDRNSRLHLAWTIMQAESKINRMNELLRNGFNPDAIKEDN